MVHNEPVTIIVPVPIKLLISTIMKPLCIPTRLIIEILMLPLPVGRIIWYIQTCQKDIHGDSKILHRKKVKSVLLNLPPSDTSASFPIASKRALSCSYSRNEQECNQVPVSQILFKSKVRSSFQAIKPKDQ